MKNNKSKRKIYKELMNEIPPNLSEEEKAAFIMMKIARERSFSSKYYWSSKETRNKIYKLCTQKNRKKQMDKRQLICVTATRMYKEFAEKLGLECYMLGDTKMTKDDFSKFKIGEHISPVIKTKDGRYIKCDVEYNLENVQTGRKWTKFGTKDPGQDMLTEISADEIHEIMKKIGYIGEDEEYLDDYIERLDLLNEKNISTLFEDPKVNSAVLNLKSSVDIYRFYRRIIKENMKKPDSIFLFGGYSNSKSQKKRYSIITHSSEDDQFWIWSNRKESMVNISKSNLKYFIDNKMINIIPGKDNNKFNKMASSLNMQSNEFQNCSDYLLSNEIWTR